MKKLLLSFGLSVLGIYGFAQMSGTYTIDAGSPASATNFQTFSAAFDELTSSGVNGAVTINVAEGTYTEQVYESNASIPGASSTNTVTIQSNPNNTNMPVWQYSSYPVYWYFCNFSFLTIKGLNIKTTGASRVLYIYYGDYNTVSFEDNVLDGYNTTSTSNFYSIIYKYYGSNSGGGFILKNNVLNEGSYGLYSYYQNGTGPIIIDSNDFNSLGYAGIYAYYMYNAPVRITGNSIEVDGTSTAYGIYSYYARGGTQIEGNNIVVSSTSTWSTKYGLYYYFSGIGGTATNKSSVANNMIVTETGTGSDNGMYLYYSAFTDVINNSVLLKSTSSAADAVYFYLPTSSTAYGSNTFYNNIMATTSTLPYTLYLYHPYNFSGGGNNLYWNGNALKNYWYTGGATSITYDLAAFDAASQTAGNYSVDPEFFGPTDLHLFNAFIDGAGANVGLDHDIDGDFRVVSSPDIGADEFGVDNNAQPTAMQSPDAPICADDTCFQVVITNTGNLNLTTVNVVWAINGNETTESWTGNLATGQSDTLTLTCNLNIVDGDSFSVYTALPNGEFDSLNVNDTIKNIVYLGLAGTYAIPGDFADLTTAVDAANKRGVCAACIMDIAPGTYNESMALREVPGTASDKTVTWRSSTGNAEDVTITFAGTTTQAAVISLTQTDWQIFEDLTVINSQTSSFGNGKTVQLSGAADNNTFQNNNLISIPTTTSSTNMANVHLSGGNMNTVIDNNWIHGGSQGVLAEGDGSNYNTEITNNHIDDFGYYGIRNYYYGGSTISDNKVINDTTIGATFQYGIYVYYSNETNVDRNYVASSETNYGLAYGIYYYQSSGTGANRASLSNNCVAVGKEGSTSYGYYGMYIYGGFIDVEGNSINRVGGYTTSVGYTPLYIANGGSIKLKNNNLVNLGGTPYAMYSGSPFYVLESENNNFFSTDPNNLIYSGAAYSNLQDWQANSGFDANSISVDPEYADTIMCATCNEDMDGAGDPTAAHADIDVNQDQRSASTPDIGAVEYVIASAFTLGPDSTYCADEITIDAGPAQSLTWSVNGNSTTAPSLTLSGGNEAVTYNVFVSLQTEHCGSASDNALITLVPNAHLDSNTHICAQSNVTLNPGGLSTGTYSWSTGASTQTIMVNAPGTYTVTKNVMGCESSATTVVTQSDDIEFITTEVCVDDLPLTLDATINDGLSYAWSGGASPTTAINTFNDGGPYSVTATDAFGCLAVDSFVVNVLEEPEAAITIPTYSGNIYVFDASTSNYLTNSSTVNWNFGAGATPATSTNVSEMVTYPWSNPSSLTSYSVSLEVNNGCGIDIATIVVTPDPLSVQDLEAGDFSVYPNPALDVVNITTNDIGAGNIQLLDLSGRVIVEAPANAGSNNHQIDVSNIAAGSYMVRISNDGSVNLKQLIIQ
ncbi:MAG: T9SS type A sorting domain-containing protein [Salibacteraceae bacterium]